MDEITNELYFETLTEAFSSDTDPDGSYTGTNPDDPFDKPVQDADDL